MTDELDPKQFQQVIRDAIQAVLGLYREGTALLRELGGVLAEGTPSFVPLIEGLVPGARGRDSDARHLRSYMGTVFVPSEVDDADDEADDDEGDDDDDDDDEESTASAKKGKAPLILGVGSAIVIARIAFYGEGADLPKLTIRVANKLDAESGLPPGTRLKISRNRFRKILRALDKNAGAVGLLKTNVTVPGVDKKKHKLTLELPHGEWSYSLFNVTPQVLEVISAEIRSNAIID